MSAAADVIVNEVRRGLYLDSVALMRMSREIAALGGVREAGLMMGTPANKAYFQELSGDPNIRATMDNARAGEPIPNIPETGRFFPAMDAALEAITNGRQAPKDALDGAAARMVIR